MAVIRSIKGQYQIVKASVPNEPTPAKPVALLNQFEAPNGFRLHSAFRLKDATLIGQPHEVLLLFEHLSEVYEEVPDDHPAVLAQMGAPQGQA